MTLRIAVLFGRPLLPEHWFAVPPFLFVLPTSTKKGCMKRTLLARKAPIKPQKKPLRRSPMPRGLTGQLSRQSYLLLTPRANGSKLTHKKRPTVETAHFRRVAMLPCARCGITGYSQAAQSNCYQDGKGAGIKAHYLTTFPLCCSRPGILGCHAEHDQCIRMTREEADARTLLYIADTQQKLGVRR